MSATQPAAAPAMREQAPGHHAARQDELAADRAADRRLAGLGYPQAVLIGSAQILALLPGISRSGVTMVAGLTRGLSTRTLPGSRSSSPPPSSSPSAP